MNLKTYLMTARKHVVLGKQDNPKAYNYDFNAAIKVLDHLIELVEAGTIPDQNLER